MQPESVDPDGPLPAGDKAPLLPTGKWEAGVPLWLVGAALCAMGAACLVAGVKAGKAIGRARLAEPTKVERIEVADCAGCREKARLAAAAAHVPSVPAATPDEVQAMLDAQRQVNSAG